ncbi:MAG: ABC transporter permease [Aigarchaeota archaeon]|nr:ABC transporter permease [Aigarchaeota archaeon]MDW8092292.1 ABC transporter permease [Nitrososphaerota archaeon]
MREVLSEISALTMRELKHWYRSPFLLVMTFVQPVLWMGLFGKAMNLTGILRVPEEVLAQLPPYISSEISAVFNKVISNVFGTPHADYFTFMSVGMPIIVILFTSMSSGISISWDRRLGFLNKLLVAPVRRGSIILAKVLSGVIRSGVQAALVLLVAVAFGAKYVTPHPLMILVLIGAILLLALGISSLFILLGIRLKSWESQMTLMNLLTLPLMFASNVFYPLDIMPQWLQVVAQLNPLTYAVDLLRQLLVTGSYENYLFFGELGGLVLFTLSVTFLSVLFAERGLRRD